MQLSSPRVREAASRVGGNGHEDGNTQSIGPTTTLVAPQIDRRGSGFVFSGFNGWSRRVLVPHQVQVGGLG